MKDLKTVTVPLQSPVTLGDVTYDKLTFRRMKARDALLGEDETSQVMAGYRIFAALADVPIEVILDLDMADLTEVGEKAALMMGKPGLAAIKDLH